MYIQILFLLLNGVLFTSCQQVQERDLPSTTALIDISNVLQSKEPIAANVVFQSRDGGQTWQDASKGLPADKQAGAFLVNGGKVYLGFGNDLFQTKENIESPVWEKVYLPNEQIENIFSGQNGLYVQSREKGIYKDMGSGMWVNAFPEIKGQFLRTIMEGQNGNLFIGSDNGIFKSADQGKTWKHVYEDGWMIHMVESDGVLLCTNQNGILRSIDGGEHWEVVISEGGVGIDVEVIKGGFAAITYNTASKTRRVRISMDGGKHWQAIDEGLPPDALIATITQMGDFLFCGHPRGIFRSSDNGKTWNLVLSSIGKKVFNLSVAGNVIFAVPKDGGC
jgi:photosystem II stability/assembly factor-like uncharacterized protein